MNEVDAATTAGRTICFDLTHLVTRLMIEAPSGIDKVDLAFARHLASVEAAPHVHYSWVGRGPHTLARSRIDEVLSILDARGWSDRQERDDIGLAALKSWISGGPRPVSTRKRGSRRRDISPEAIKHWRAQARLLLTDDRVRVPENAIYLNVAQLLLEQPRFFRWLDGRPDVVPVFFIHDLLPLDMPEYWAAGYREKFERRIATALRYGKAFVTSTESVKQRLIEERRRRGLADVPVHAAALPSSLVVDDRRALRDAELSSHPYFVIVGTIEPRKNHLLLLNIWRRFAERGGNVPKLLVVGARGWENEQTMDVLDRSRAIGPHVHEVSGLATGTLATLIANARALLMPSFAEGYGLPVAEALSLGTPVIASDIGVFRETSQGLAMLRHPLDGLGWMSAIEQLAADNSAARLEAGRFVAPDWAEYFRRLGDFLGRL